MRQNSIIYYPLPFFLYISHSSIQMSTLTVIQITWWSYHCQLHGTRKNHQCSTDTGKSSRHWLWEAETDSWWTTASTKASRCQREEWNPGVELLTGAVTDFDTSHTLPLLPPYPMPTPVVLCTLGRTASNNWRESYCPISTTGADIQVANDTLLITVIHPHLLRQV